MLHDQSATGSTLFIEPASVVKLNNEIRQLELDEQEEIEKILANLSNQTAEQSFFIEQDFRILSELDFIFAKAMLSKNMKGTRPIFPKEKYIDIKDGRHPLIDPKKVVPINLHLGRTFLGLIRGCLPSLISIYFSFGKIGLVPFIFFESIALAKMKSSSESILKSCSIKKLCSAVWLLKLASIFSISSCSSSSSCLISLFNLTTDAGSIKSVEPVADWS